MSWSGFGPQRSQRNTASRDSNPQPEAPGGTDDHGVGWSTGGAGPHQGVAAATSSVPVTRPNSFPESFGVPPLGHPARREHGWFVNIRSQEQRFDRLRKNAREAVTNNEDQQLQAVLRQSFAEMPPGSRPSLDSVVSLVSRFLDLANQRLEARDAAMYLAHAHWDYPVAVARYMGERFDDDEALVSEPEDGSEEEVHVENEDEEEEEEEEEAVDDDADAQEALRLLNRAIDRAPAVRHRRDDSKLEIRIKNGKGKRDTVYRFHDQHPDPVDWAQPMRVLNRWRAQIFRRTLGNARPARVKFHELEKRFLVDMHLRFEQKMRAAGKLVNWSSMRWSDVASEFNQRFAGQILPGDNRPRPTRTAVALRTERARIKEITDMTGIAPKDQKPERPK
ncbi:hypothetical protein MMC24_004057 [Lignoscripta atroalba]|nr:hypothetical protein [Lignoscripta atroalba]